MAKKIELEPKGVIWGPKKKEESDIPPWLWVVLVMIAAVIWNRLQQ